MRAMGGPRRWRAWRWLVPTGNTRLAAGNGRDYSGGEDAEGQGDGSEVSSKRGLPSDMSRSPHRDRTQPPPINMIENQVSARGPTDFSTLERLIFPAKSASIARHRAAWRPSDRSRSPTAL